MSVRLNVVFMCFIYCLMSVQASDVYVVDPTQAGGRRFDGIGGLSGGGATSKLLVNYPQQQRDQILDYLFKPGFGASLHILKVEIGGDAQSTDGTEASHMHYPWEENYQRGYEWWLLTEAKKRNPDILLYCLPWAFPAWVGAGTRNPYHKPELTAGYVIKFLLGAKKYYNLTMNYVGIWNERPYDTHYIKTLRQMLDSAGLTKVQIVAADGTWEPLALDMTIDKALADAIDIIGVHYPGTKSSSAAVSLEKPLWSSEDYSTLNDNVGAGCWARILNQNYVNGNMTSTISWNLIASYYENLPFKRDGLMTADTPWSGYYRVESPIWMTAHTSQFAWPGWKYLAHGHGAGHLNNGGSMVSLVSADNTQLTIVIETMSHDHSKCIRPGLPAYTVKPQDIIIRLNGQFAQTVEKMNVRYSKLGFDGDGSTLFMEKDAIPVVNGTIKLSLGVDEVYTLSTISTATKGNYPDIPTDQPFPLPYRDDFESYALHSEPYNLAQQIGAFEVLASPTATHGNIIRQMVLEYPCAWCQAENVTSSMNVIGNYTWSDIYVEADTYIGTVNATKAVYIASRLSKGGCNSFAAEGVFFFLFPGQGLEVTGDLARTQKLYSKDMNVSTDTWYKMGLLVKDGYAAGTIDGKLVFNISAPGKPAPQNGYVGLGTASYGLADFDNLKILSSQDGFKQITADHLDEVEVNYEKYLDNNFGTNLGNGLSLNKGDNKYVIANKNNGKLSENGDSEELYFESLKDENRP